MASLIKDGNRWKAQVCVNGIRKSKRFDSKTQAKNWATRTEVLLARMVEGESLNHTLGQVFDRYAAEVSETKKGAQWEIVRLNSFKKYKLLQDW